MKEILTIHVGGAGCQIGDHLWELYCKEHGINHSDGTSISDKQEHDSTVAFSSSESLFYESGDGQHAIPLSLYFDNESGVIDKSKQTFKQLFPKDNMIGGKEDASNNYARGFYTIGKELIYQVMDRIRLLSEKCDSLQGIQIVNSLGGGTGSGSGMLLLNRLGVDYKVPIHCNTIVPSPKLCDTVVESYNFCWSMQELLEHDKASATFYDNEALYDVCCNHLGVSDPNFSHINQIIAQHMATTFSSCRVGSAESEGSSPAVSMNDILQNLIPLPRVQLLSPSFVPFGASQMSSMEERGRLAFQPSNTLISYNMLEGKMLSSYLQHRGNVNMGDYLQCLRAVKKLEGLSCGPSWISNCFHCHVSKAPTTIVDNSVVSKFEKTLAVTTNTTAINVKLKQIAQKYDKLWSKRAFVHWYVGEGLEDECCTYGRSVVEERIALNDEIASL